VSLERRTLDELREIIDLGVMIDYRTLTVRQVYDEAEAIGREAETRFGGLSDNQLNWRVIVYSLLDTIRLIVAHERRHLAQAQRVTTAPGFPGNGARYRELSGWIPRL
jgi:hypothetical protein